MKAINPTAIDEGVLQYTTVGEDDRPEWVSGTTYAAGAQVIRGSTRRAFESVAAGNVGHIPESSPAQWVDAGPTNRWAMFDRAVGTATAADDPIYVNLSPGAINAVAAIDTTAETVRVQMQVDGTTIYDKTKSTNAGGGMVQDWYAYFTAEVGKVAALTFLDLPIYSNGAVLITLTGADPTGPVSIGTLLVGSLIDLGTTEAGPSIGINDFSRKETDAFGVTDVVERAWAKRMTIRSLVPTQTVDSIQRRLATLRAKPALWLGEEGYDSLTIYGFFKDFSIDLALPNVSYCSLTIEGLI